MRKAGLEATGYDDLCILQCVADETDGFISDDNAEEIGDLFRCKHWRKLADLLVTVRRWTRDDGKGGWWIHDFLEFNFSHEEMEALRARNKRNGKRGGDAKAKRVASDSLSVPLQNSLANGYRNGTNLASEPLSPGLAQSSVSVSVSDLAVDVDELKSSSNAAKTDDDDPESVHQGAWQAAQQALRDRTTPENLAKLGPVRSPRHWLAVAYRNQLDDLKRAKLEDIDRWALEIGDLETYDQPSETIDNIATYLGQSRAIAQRTINSANELDRRTHPTRCPQCHDRRLINIDHTGDAIWCPICRPGWLTGDAAIEALKTGKAHTR